MHMFPAATDVPVCNPAQRLRASLLGLRSSFLCTSVDMIAKGRTGAFLAQRIPRANRSRLNGRRPQWEEKVDGHLKAKLRVPAVVCRI
jgi:hypothetical protein